MGKKQGGQTTWRSQAREGLTPIKAKKPVARPAAVPEEGGADDVDDALTMAAMQGDESTVAALLDAGANANAKDAIGVAPLHWGAFCGHAGVTGRLLAANADVHVRDQEGRTPLHVAAYESHTEVIAQLLKSGSDVMAPDKLSWTPLHCAVSNGGKAACKQLVDAGADPNRKDSEGKSSMDLAKHFGNTDVMALLESAQETRELLALKDLGIGSHRGPRVSPNSVSSQLAPVALS